MIRNLFIVVVTTILFAACSSAPKGIAAPLGLVSASPEGDAVPVDSIVRAVFDSALDNVGKQAITVRSGGNLISGRVSYDAATFTLTFMPATKLAYGASYSVDLAADLVNEAGLGMASAHGWSFATVTASADATTPTNPANPTDPSDPTNPTSPDTDGDGVADDQDNAPNVYNPGQEDTDGDGIADVIDNAPYVYNPGQEDTDGDGVADVIDSAPNYYNPGQENVEPSHIVAPTVIAVDPGQDATNTDVDGIVTASFNVALDEVTLTEASFTLTANGQSVPGIVDYDPDSNSAVFGSLAALEYGTTYTATLKASIKSAAGVAMAQDLVWSFSTALDSSSVVPAVPGSASGFSIIARSPQSRATGVVRSSSITVEFSKPLDPATVTLKTFRLKRAKGGFVKGAVRYAATTDITGVPHYLVTFTPNAALSTGTNYRFKVDGSVADTEGDSLGKTSQWFFKTQ